MTKREMFERWCSNGGVRKSRERERLRRMTLYCAGGFCRWCGRRLPLHQADLHHEQPYRSGDPRGSVTLHNNCHWTVHLLRHHLGLLYQDGRCCRMRRNDVRRHLRRLGRLADGPAGAPGL